MSDTIRVSLTPETVSLQPGGDVVEVIVSIQNTGTTVDQYAVELDGLPTTWYTLANTSVALFPQDREEAKILIRPPKTAGTKAGAYPFSVVVLSRADSAQTTRVEGRVEMGAVAAFDCDISPRKVIGRTGRYKLTLRNGGNADLDLTLEAEDNQGKCRCSFSSPTPHLGPGQQSVVTLKVKPQRSGLVGERRPFDIAVKVQPNQGDAKALQVQLVHSPRFRTWKPFRRLALLIIVAAIALAVVSALGGFTPVSRSIGNVGGLARTGLCTRLHVFCASSKSNTGGYHFVHAFHSFHLNSPSLIGRAVEDEHYTNHGFTIQNTSTGLLIYNTKDTSTYFIAKNDAVYQWTNGSAHEVSSGR